MADPQAKSDPGDQANENHIQLIGKRTREKIILSPPSEIRKKKIREITQRNRNVTDDMSVRHEFGIVLQSQKIRCRKEKRKSENTKDP